MDSGSTSPWQRSTRFTLASGEKLVISVSGRGLRIYQLSFGVIWARKVYETDNVSGLTRPLFGESALQLEDLISAMANELRCRRIISEVKWLLRPPNRVG